MGPSDYVEVGGEEFEAARPAATGSLRSAVLAAGRKRDAVGQRHFPWDSAQRGEETCGVPTA